MWPSLPLAVLCHHGTSHWQSPLLMYLSNRTFPYKLLYLNSKPLTANREYFTINFAPFPTNYQQKNPWNGHMTQPKNMKKHGTLMVHHLLFPRAFCIAKKDFPSLLPTAAPLGRFGHHIGLNHLAARQRLHFGEVILNFEHLMIYTEAININTKKYILHQQIST